MTVDTPLLEVIGSGEWAFTPVVDWPRLPDDLVLGDVAGVAIDGHDRIVLFNRGATPVVVVTPEGDLLHAWGEGLFENPHGASFDADGHLYLTDNALHVVRKYSIDGTLLLEIGTPGRASPFMSNEPFHRCTHSAVAPDGDILVSDGYGNAAVHRFGPTGEHKTSWGRPGVRRGEFHVPHNIACDARGRVYVADRENDRVQIFDGAGRFLRQIVDMHRPSGMTITRDAEPLVIVGELATSLDLHRATPNIGGRLSVFDQSGHEVAAIMQPVAVGTGPGQFLSPHSLALDSHGSLYVGEVGRADWDAIFPGEPMPERLRGAQKLQRARPAGDESR